jgi:hypothetical protein
MQKVVKNFGNVLFQLAEHQLTNTYAVVLHFCELENLEYLVLRYLNTGTLPFEEFSEHWFFHGEA